MAISVACVVLICAGLVVFFLGGPKPGGDGAAIPPESPSASSTVTEPAFDEMKRLHETVAKSASQFTDESGFVAFGDVQNAVADVAKDVTSEMGDSVDDYIVESDCVSFVLKSGIHYVYRPNVKGIWAGSRLVSTYEPHEFLGSYQVVLAEDSSVFDDLTIKGADIGKDGLVDSDADYIARELAGEGYSVGRFFDNNVVSVDEVKNFGKDQIVLWEGHGGYDSINKSYLILGTMPPIMESLFTDKRSESKTAISRDDFTEPSPRLIIVNGYIAVTPEFFNFYYSEGDLDGSVFYLGACQSLRSDDLASALVGKGASAVIGNTRDAYVAYQANIRDVIITELCAGSTLEEALNAAKSKHGDNQTKDFFDWLRQDFTGETSFEFGRVAYYPDTAGDLVLVDSPTPDAPKDAAKFNGNAYKVYSEWKSWDEAKAACEELGGHLATITSPQEQAFIEELNGSQRSWIGGYRDSDDDWNWKWVTGEEWSYEHWASGEPNDSSNVISNETKVAIWPSKWNDLNEASKEQSGYVCEWDHADIASTDSDAESKSR